MPERSIFTTRELMISTAEWGWGFIEDFKARTYRITFRRVLVARIVDMTNKLKATVVSYKNSLKVDPPLRHKMGDTSGAGALTPAVTR